VTTAAAPLPPDWQSVLATVEVGEQRPPGEGWQTAREIAIAGGRSVSAIGHRMRRLMDDGAVETWRGLQVTPLGRRLQVWYRPRI
jgi:hypothetical protein